MTKPVAGFNANPQNINRSGAPKKEWTMKGLIEEALEEQNEEGVPYKKLLAQKLRNVALKGDVVAIKEINNRLDGMPRQTTDLTSGGKPIPLLSGITDVPKDNSTD